MAWRAALEAQYRVVHGVVISPTMEPMLTINPCLRSNMEGSTAFDTRRAPKVFSSNDCRICSMVASAIGLTDSSNCSRIVHDDVDPAHLFQDTLHSALNVIFDGHVQDARSDVWALKALHGLEPAGGRIHDASSRSEFLTQRKANSTLGTTSDEGYFLLLDATVFLLKGNLLMECLLCMVGARSYTGISNLYIVMPHDNG